MLTAFIVLLLLACVILSVCLFWSVKLNVRAGGELISYEQFYEDSIETLVSLESKMRQLRTRPLLSDDPEVRMVHEVVVNLHELLIGYINAREGILKKERK